MGHEKTLAFLERTVAEGRPAHGYLFTGREGVGKRLVARKFACMLNCLRPRNDPDESCSACRRISQGQHPDFQMETPERGSIRIERVRGIRGFFQYAPVEANFRVCIVDDAHTMNRSAQNALLKTLEEPPAGRILILVTSNPALLLPTVRSRCRRVRFGPVPVPLLTAFLEQRGIVKERAAVLAAMSSGSVSRALEMNENSFISLREKMVMGLTDAAGLGIAGALELSLDISKDRKTAREALEVGCTWIRDLLVATVGCETSPMLHVDFLDRIHATAQHLNSEQLFSVYAELVKASELIEAEINVNRTIVTDVMMLRILRLLAGPTMGVAPSTV